MTDLIKTVMDAKDEYRKNWGGEPDLLFMHPTIFEGLMRLPEVQLAAATSGVKVFGCDYIFDNIDDFDVLASSHDQMRRISAEHVGTTDDVKLLKLEISGNPMIDPSNKVAHEYITIPYHTLVAYRYNCEQHKVDKLW